jgi:elongation factor 2
MPGQDKYLSAKSANKHNHLFVEADTIGAELSNPIDNGDINPDDDPKFQGCKLADDFGWDVTEAHKIWAFGTFSLILLRDEFEALM